MTSQSVLAPKPHPATKLRPSIHSNRHMSYPAWPSPKPAPLTLNAPLRFGGHDSTSSVDVGGPSFHSLQYRPALKHKQKKQPDAPFLPGIELGQTRNAPVSPMLSEPFHRLIVKDEEEFVDLSGAMASDGTSMDDDQEMKTVPEEGEDLTNWWYVRVVLGPATVLKTGQGTRFGEGLQL